MKTITLRARWTGEPPAVGAYLMAQTRPKFAYRIVAVTPRGKVYELTCTRAKPSEVPDGATVYPWKWDTRTKAGVAWTPDAQGVR